MLRLDLLWLLSAALLAVACTAANDVGPELTGVWQVSTHTRNPSGCTPGPAETDPPYLRFSKEQVFGKPYYLAVDCVDAATCDPVDPLFGLAYARSIPGGYEAVLYVPTGDSTRCSLSATVSQATVSGDGRLTITTYEHRKADLVGNACGAADAQSAFDAGQLDCSGFEHLTGVRP